MVGVARRSESRLRNERSVSHIRTSSVVALRSPVNRHVVSSVETSSALGAALEALGAPAFVLGANGDVLHASRAGRRLLDGDRQGLAQALRDAASGCAHDGPLSLTRFDGARECGYLAVFHAPELDGGFAEQIAAAKTRWKLTARQAEVLDLAARGLTNATIGEMLGIGSSTVEFHLHAIFDKAGVDNRATLVARVLEL